MNSKRAFVLGVLTAVGGMFGIAYAMEYLDAQEGPPRS